MTKKKIQHCFKEIEFNVGFLYKRDFASFFDKIKSTQHMQTITRSRGKHVLRNKIHNRKGAQIINLIPQHQREFNNPISHIYSLPISKRQQQRTNGKLGFSMCNSYSELFCIFLGKMLSKHLYTMLKSNTCSGIKIIFSGHQVHQLYYQNMSYKTIFHGTCIIQG